MNATPETRARYREALPQLANVPFLSDGGIETTLIFHAGHDLPFFAAYDLLARDGGEEALRRYFEPYVRMARDHGLGIVLETATWRANVDWAERLGHTPEQLDGLNRAAVSLLVALREEHESGTTPIVISGCIGPRGDGYVVGDAMSAAEAAVYHSQQIRTLCDAGVDLVTGLTMTYTDEAVGIVQAARGAALPVVISFTVETDGRLPSGQPLREAIEEVDDRTSAAPAYYMINCAHPSHFSSVLHPDAAWMARIRGIRANASSRSHAELDEASELDSGDPVAFGREYAELRSRFPTLTVLGGCCGSDVRHIRQVASACL